VQARALTKNGYSFGCDSDSAGLKEAGEVALLDTLLKRSCGNDPSAGSPTLMREGKEGREIRLGTGHEDERARR